MRFLQECLSKNTPAGIQTERFLELFAETEFDRAALLTQAAQCLAPELSTYAPAPEEGWLRTAYAYLTDSLFPDPDYRAPAAETQQGIALLLSVLEALLACEDAPFDPLTDFLPIDSGLPTHIPEEYGRFCRAAKEHHFLLTLRMSRELMPFDAASHTIGVRNVAVRTAVAAHKAGLPVDVPLVASASLSHDIGKFACRGADAARVPYLHYYYTWQWLADRDLEKIAHIAANHSTWDLEFENLTIESLLLIYADFRVRGRQENGREVMRICTLEEAYGIILSKLADVTPEKRRRYRLVYSKLRDFELFLRGRGVQDDGSTVPPVTCDAALRSQEDALCALRDLTFANNIRLMNAISTDASFDLLLEQARGERDSQRIRTYLRLFDEYNTYMSRSNKQKLLNYLYELLMYPEGDVRRVAGHIMGQILANSGPRYRKMLPAAAPKSAMAPTMLALLDESVTLWDSYVMQCLHPDHKIAHKHALRISNSLKAICESLFASCEPELAPELARPLFAHFDGLPETDCFVLFDAMCHVPPSAVSKELFSAAEAPLLRMLRSGVDRWQLNALHCIYHLRECASEEFLHDAAQPGCEESTAVVYLREKLFGAVPSVQQDVSLLYLSNLKNAVHWTVKIVQIDMLCDDVKIHGENAFHTAMHLSNLLSVSEHLPVREHAGEALLSIADNLTVDQRNEIAVDLLRELENGQEQIARFIPPYLGKLVCSLPEKEILEAVDFLEALLRSGTVRPAGPALAALGSLIAALPEGACELTDRCLGLLLVGVAHYHAPIHQSALCVLCQDLIANETLPLRLKSYCFTRIHKKLLTLLSEPEPGRLSFFNRAAMLNQLYRFQVHYAVEQGAFQFDALKPVAFFPGTFDPFSAGHKAIVEEIRARGFEVYLAVDEFSWSKRTLAKLLRRKIARMSVADQWDTYLFPDDVPINIAMPEDLAALRACFPGREVRIVAGSDVIRHASAYHSDAPNGAAAFDHIIVRRPAEEEDGLPPVSAMLRGSVIEFSLPAQMEDISSTRIRDSIDKNLDISALVDPVVQAYIYEYGLYLRFPILKRVLTPQDLYFTGEGARVSLCSRRLQRLVGFAGAHSLTIAELYDELHDVEACSAVRRRTSGKLLMIDEVEDGGAQEYMRMLLNELLVRSLTDDHTYALCRCAQTQDTLRDVLLQLGFVRVEEVPELYYVDMCKPMVLIQDLLLGIKTPHRDAPEVLDAVEQSRPRLRTALTALYPGKLLLCFDAELLNQALMHRVQQHDHAGGVKERFLCVPYGKILSGEVVPGTMTKTLHADKCFAPDGSNFSVVEYPGYSSLPNQVRTLKSFRRPVILVDDLLHKGYRIGKLNPIFEREGLEINRIIVGILSGRGRDLMREQHRKVDCEYFVPNLHYWVTESLLYPFIGGDSVSGRKTQGRMLPSISLILPYFYPRHFTDAAQPAVRELSRTALTNALCVLRALERVQQRSFNTVLTLRRLGEAVEHPRLPDRGKALNYDFSIPASAYLEDDLLTLDRTRTGGGAVNGA